MTREQIEQQVAELTYKSTQHTMCAVCGADKHTPLRRDEMGGYVCLTCIDKQLTEQATDIDSYEQQLQSLTAERDEARKLKYSDEESHYWGPYHREKDGAISGGNIGHWYDTAVFWRNRAEAAEQAGITFGDFPYHFTATNTLAQQVTQLQAALDKLMSAWGNVRGFNMTGQQEMDEAIDAARTLAGKG